MAYSKVYNRINWKNEDESLETPLNALNLNKMDYAVNELDNRVITLDTSKAEKTMVEASLRDITYDTEKGIFVFTWNNGSSKTVDLNIEKIPVSFSMDESGVITMITTDGERYTADIGAMIIAYDFEDSGTIEFQVRTDENGDKHIKADILEGSIGEDKLQPHYLADITIQAQTASAGATNASRDALVSEGWAKGTQNGVPVGSSSPYYHNNAEYFKDVTPKTSLEALDDVNLSALKDKQALVYDATSQKWVNGAAMGGANDVELTLDQYNALPDSKYTDGVHYLITDWAESGGGGGASKWEDLKDKPFESIGANLTVDAEGKLNAEAGVDVVDILTSTSKEDALSANMGRTLNESLNNKEMSFKHYDSDADALADIDNIEEGQMVETDDYEGNNLKIKVLNYKTSALASNSKAIGGNLGSVSLSSNSEFPTNRVIGASVQSCFRSANHAFVGTATVDIENDTILVNGTYAEAYDVSIIVFYQ